MIGGVTRLGGLPGLPGRVTLSTGVTICHVNVLRWGNPPSRSRVPGKKLKSETFVLKLRTFPSRLVAEITRHRNGHRTKLQESVNGNVAETCNSMFPLCLRKSGPVPLYTQQRKREKTSRNR